jgi:hypothetical protein
MLVHGAVIRAEPINQCLDIELCGLAAHRVTAIDVDGLVGSQGLRAFSSRNRSMCQWILPSIFIGLWIIKRLGKCSGCTSKRVIFTWGLQRLQSNLSDSGSTPPP